MLGATLRGSRCHFRVWAPEVPQVMLEIDDDGQLVPLDAADGGYHCIELPGVCAGQRYRYLVNGSRLPDPCSRFQPEGPHGSSQIVDTQAYRWNDAGWRGIGLTGLVVYEMHTGTFTREGTFAAAIARLEHLRELGITAVELMPVAECPGLFNWGYDGVGWFAPSHNYGPYDALKAFVDAAHAAGIGVILDVVYNHFGPDGNFAPAFSPHYLTGKATEWGEAINFDGPHAAAVREMVIANACQWVREFHVDGLRLDATHSILDGSGRHVVAELAAAVRAAAGDRRVLVIEENESQRATHLLPEHAGGQGLDAMWNDDFHHTALVAATGRRDAYYHDYYGSPQEFVSMARRGFLYQGQYYPWQRQLRGQPLQVPPRHCIACLQNHDQIANSVRGLRLHQLASPGVCRALTAVLLLGPQTPMLFMGQEFHASAPFLYFADHQEPLRGQVREGRGDFLRQFPDARSADGAAAVADPGDEGTFRRCKLDWAECTPDHPALRLHRDLLTLRRDDPVLQEQHLHAPDGAVLSQGAFLLRWFHPAAGDRLLIVNLGADLRERPLPEPLLAPPPGRHWSTLWSSERTAYGGSGEVDPVPAHGWHLPGQCAILLAAVEPEVQGA